MIWFFIIWLLLFLGIIWCFIWIYNTKKEIYNINKQYEKDLSVLKESENKRFEDSEYRIKKYELLMQNENELKHLLEKQTKNSSVGYIYIYKCSGNYKIWLASCRKSRIKQHLVSSPEMIDLVVLLEVFNMNFIEKLLHATFQDKRLYWEWFSLNDLDINIIKEYFWSYLIKR